jgi:ABC-2 type transport system permease protein
MLITLVGMVFYIGIYFVLPSDVDETLSLAIHAPVVPPAFAQMAGQEGVEVEYFPSREALRQAVLDSEFQVGIALQADVMDVWAAGGKPEILIFYSSGAPVEIRDAIVTLVKELAYVQTGQALNFETTQEVLGPDMLGAQITLRDRMRPMLAVFILLVEIMTLASLISIEIEQGTARALFVTPMRVSELFIAKGVMGVGLALGQSILFMALVNGFNHQPLIILTALVVGSTMVVGLGFLLASVARDLMAVMGWGMLLFIILAIPGFGAVIPGLLSDWARVIPSYFLIDTVTRTVNYGAGWADIGTNLAILTGFTAVVVWGGMVALKRRYQ